MNDDWTWSETGEQALNGIICVFVILIPLTLLVFLTIRVLAAADSFHTFW